MFHTFSFIQPTAASAIGAGVEGSNAPLDSVAACAVPGREKVLQILQTQLLKQGSHIFQTFSMCNGVSVQGTAYGAECLTQGCNSCVERYPSGDFIKALRLDDGKLLLILIDLPGKGVVPDIDWGRQRILAEDSSIAVTTLLLHERMEQRINARDLAVLQQHAPCGKVSTFNSHCCGVTLEQFLAKVPIIEQVSIIEALTHPYLVSRDSYPAAAYVSIDPSTGKGEYLNRGHTMPLVIVRAVKDGGHWCNVIENHSGFMGVADRTQMRLDAERFELADGDVAMLISDGLGDGNITPQSIAFQAFPDVIKTAFAEKKCVQFVEILIAQPEALFSLLPETEDPVSLLEHYVSMFKRHDDTSWLTYRHGTVADND